MKLFELMKELSTYNKDSEVFITTRAKDTDEYVTDITSIENLFDFNTVKINTDLYCYNLDNNKQLAEISNKDIASIVCTLGYIKDYFEDFCTRNKEYPCSFYVDFIDLIDKQISYLQNLINNGSEINNVV